MVPQSHFKSPARIWTPPVRLATTAAEVSGAVALQRYGVRCHDGAAAALRAGYGRFPSHDSHATSYAEIGASFGESLDPSPYYRQGATCDPLI